MSTEKIIDDCPGQLQFDAARPEFYARPRTSPLVDARSIVAEIDCAIRPLRDRYESANESEWHIRQEYKDLRKRLDEVTVRLDAAMRDKHAASKPYHQMLDLYKSAVHRLENLESQLH